ncbi:tRNA (guanine-N(7)-)-methyltransferase non-catalytic subunit trm82 [Actinomortierella wolfii]|nr:tRNA (guanine-N(7)-)-methyltransferase non-catalytic subunit trm82 [Actinomortierella wolfii]
MPRLPFSNIVHHPTKDLVVLSFGEHFQAVDTKTGNIVCSTLPLEERASATITAPELTNTPDASKLHKTRITVMAFSPDGAYLATASDDKIMKVWDTDSWTCLGSRTLVRRSNALQFNAEGNMIVTADKFGDIYKYCPTTTNAMVRDLPDVDEKEKSDKAAEKKTEGGDDDNEDETENGEQPILGHVSMATDLALTRDNKYIITADRDEHIRVSHYPKGYIIETFCLGHTSFVSQVEHLPGHSDKYLVSSGGDGTFRVWEFLKGKLVLTVDLREILGLPPAPAPAASESEASTPASATEESGDSASATPSSAVKTNYSDLVVRSFSISEVKKHIAAVIEKSSKVVILEWSEAAEEDGVALKPLKVVELQGETLDVEYDRSGRLWTSVVPNTEDADAKIVAVYDDDYQPIADLALPINTFGSMTVETLPDLFNTDELRKHTTDWREVKRQRDEKRAAEAAAAGDSSVDGDDGPNKKRKRSRKMPEHVTKK